MAFYRKQGKENVYTLTAKTATAIAKGDLVKIDGTNNQVDAFTTGATCLGIALTAKAASTAGTVKVDVLKRREIFVGDVSSGTPASGDIRACDAASASGITLTNSNSDFIFMYNGTTTTVDLFIS